MKLNLFIFCKNDVVVAAGDEVTNNKIIIKLLNFFYFLNVGSNS